MLHLHRGTPYVYQGEELGLTNAGFGGIEDYRDIESLNHYAEARRRPARSPERVLAALRVMSRDNARTPMPVGSPGGDAAEVNWIPRLAVGFHHYRRLIQLRHDEPAGGAG